MHLEQLVQQGQQHRIIVRHDEQIDAGQIGAGLEVAKRMADLAALVRVGDEDLPAYRRLLPRQYELRQRARLELVLVERQILNDQRLLAGARELDVGMGRTRWQRARRYVGPEALGYGPEADGEALLGRARNVDQTPARVPGGDVAEIVGQYGADVVGVGVRVRW